LKTLKARRAHLSAAGHFLGSSTKKNATNMRPLLRFHIPNQDAAAPRPPRTAIRAEITGDNLGARHHRRQ
jgi:hypothetical protein